MYLDDTNAGSLRYDEGYPGGYELNPGTPPGWHWLDGVAVCERHVIRLDDVEVRA